MLDYGKDFGMWSRELQPGMELHHYPWDHRLNITLDVREKVSGCGKDVQMMFAVCFQYRKMFSASMLRICAGS